jgi:leucyl/phenylalanyl-tRNA--protein transferase
VFPWYSAQQPILWWSPDPRMVLLPGEFKLSRSLAKTLRNGPYTTRLDSDFSATIRACAAPRRSGAETWLNLEMIGSYEELHRLGFGHSVETYRGERLVGGLYGIHLGGVFFGESMWSGERDASKVALARLVQECRSRTIQLIDCQIASAHLASLGAREISRGEFAAFLRRHARRAPCGPWA